MVTNRRHFLSGAASAVLAGSVPGIARGATSERGSRVKPGARDVLIVVDVQNDFIPGGALPVNDGDEVVPLINRVATAFQRVVLTQDWHTPNHISFASTHPGRQPFETIKVPYGLQVLWPDHTLQGSHGADFHKDLNIPHAELIIRKGSRRNIDSYSVFYEADGRTPTGLLGYLRERGLTQIFLAGLATDFCVRWSALDARRAGLSTHVIEDATRGIDANGSLGKAWAAMTRAGVKRLKSSDVAL